MFSTFTCFIKQTYLFYKQTCLYSVGTPEAHKHPQQWSQAGTAVVPRGKDLLPPDRIVVSLSKRQNKQHLPIPSRQEEGAMRYA
jgi:hypothetical protein